MPGGKSNDLQVDTDFGILTSCYQKDYLKAIAMSLSIQNNSKNKYPVAVIAPEEIFPVLRPYFDFLIIEKRELKGFEHKIYLDEYTPFKETLFLDSDILVYKDMRYLYEIFSAYDFIAQGKYTEPGAVSSFGLSSSKALQLLNRSKLSNVSGAGHYFFKLPAGKSVFTKAREIAQNYAIYGDNLRFADEDIINIALTSMDLGVYEKRDFMGMPIHAKKRTLSCSVVNGFCQYDNIKFGLTQPMIMHFAARQAVFLYVNEILSLFSKFHVPVNLKLKMFYYGSLWFYDYVSWKVLNLLRKR